MLLGSGFAAVYNADIMPFSGRFLLLQFSGRNVYQFAIPNNNDGGASLDGFFPSVNRRSAHGCLG